MSYQKDSRVDGISHPPSKFTAMLIIAICITKSSQINSFDIILLLQLLWITFTNLLQIFINIFRIYIIHIYIMKYT